MSQNTITFIQQKSNKKWRRRETLKWKRKNIHINSTILDVSFKSLLIWKISQHWESFCNKFLNIILISIDFEIHDLFCQLYNNISLYYSFFRRIFNVFYNNFIFHITFLVFIINYSIDILTTQFLYSILSFLIFRSLEIFLKQILNVKKNLMI